jgi:hypothetical protein
MESLSPFLWGSCIPYYMPVYPDAHPCIEQQRPRIPHDQVSDRFFGLMWLVHGKHIRRDRVW